MWIEIFRTMTCEDLIGSRPARALWIEIIDRWSELVPELVEAREGLVD